MTLGRGLLWGAARRRLKRDCAKITNLILRKTPGNSPSPLCRIIFMNRYFKFCSFFIFILILDLIVYGCSDSKRQSLTKNKTEENLEKTSFISKPKFPHDKHTDEQQIACKTCHHETNAAKLKFPHQQYFKDFWIDCKICHHDKDKPQEAVACSDCHKLSLTNIADETLSSKVVIHKSCGRQGCHEIGRGEDASKSCSDCHEEE